MQDKTWWLKIRIVCYDTNAVRSYALSWPFSSIINICDDHNVYGFQEYLGNA